DGVSDFDVEDPRLCGGPDRRNGSGRRIHLARVVEIRGENVRDADAIRTRAVRRVRPEVAYDRLEGRTVEPERALMMTMPLALVGDHDPLGGAFGSGASVELDGREHAIGQALRRESGLRHDRSRSTEQALEAVPAGIGQARNRRAAHDAEPEPLEITV